MDRLELVGAGEAKTTSSGTAFVIPKDFRPLEFVNKSLTQAAFEGSVTCRVWLETTLEDLGHEALTYASSFEVKYGGVLMTFLAHPDWFSHMALYLLGIPVPMRVLEPPELKDAFIALGKRAETAALGA